MSDSLDSTDLDSSTRASLLDAELSGGPAATRSAVELSLDEDKVCFRLAWMCQRPFQRLHAGLMETHCRFYLKFAS